MFKKFQACGCFLKEMKQEISCISSHERKKSYQRMAMIYATWLLITLIGFSLSGKAHADIVSHGIFDDITKSYKDATGGWSSVLVGYAHTLFFYLASIEIAWAGILWVMEKDNLNSFTAALVKKIMWLGFFYALLLNFDVWVPAIINSFAKAGQSAAHLSNGISPSLVIETGLKCLDHIMSAVSKLGFWTGMFPSLMASLCSLFILGCFFVIALQLLAALVESYIVLSAGVIFLGFGGSRLTSDFVQKFLGYAVSVGVKLFMIYLIIGIGQTFSDGWSALLQGEDKDLIRSFVVIAGSTFIYAGLVWMIPKFAASLMSGVSTMTAGSMVGTAAMSTAGAATVATGAMETASSAINSTLKAGGFVGKGIGAIGKRIGQGFSNSASLGGSGDSSGSGNSVGSASAFNMPAPKHAASGSHATNVSNRSADTSEKGQGMDNYPHTDLSSNRGISSSASHIAATNQQNTGQADNVGASLDSQSASSSSSSNVAPPEDGGGSIGQESTPTGKINRLLTAQQVLNHVSKTLGANSSSKQRVQPPQIPDDAPAGHGVHIKLDHPHD